MTTTRSLAIVLVVSVSAIAPAQSQVVTRWCAAPRADEPLLRDAHDLGTSDDSVWVAKRFIHEVPRVSSEAIVLVRDEAICHRAARAYGDRLRRFVDKKWRDVPVVVVRIGEMYLVDDLRPRDGSDAYWEVMLFDKTWRKRLSYGGGS